MIGRQLYSTKICLTWQVGRRGLTAWFFFFLGFLEAAWTTQQQDKSFDMQYSHILSPSILFLGTMKTWKPFSRSTIQFGYSRWVREAQQFFRSQNHVNALSGPPPNPDHYSGRSIECELKLSSLRMKSTIHLSAANNWMACTFSMAKVHCSGLYFAFINIRWNCYKVKNFQEFLVRHGMREIPGKDGALDAFLAAFSYVEELEFKS